MNSIEKHRQKKKLAAHDSLCTYVSLSRRRRKIHSMAMKKRSLRDEWNLAVDALYWFYTRIWVTRKYINVAVLFQYSNAEYVPIQCRMPGV